MFIRLKSQLRDAFFLLAASFVLMPTAAHAYVDPGSGSVIVTTILGLIAAVSYTFRKFFYNLRSKLFGSTKQENSRSLDD